MNTKLLALTLFCLAYATPKAQTPFPYANDFEQQTDFLLLQNYPTLGSQIGAEIWPDLLDNAIAAAGDHMGWAYLTSRVCIFMVGIDYLAFSDNEMWVFVLFSLEPVDVDAIRRGTKKIKDFQWTIGSGAHFFDWYMSDLTFHPSDFRLDRPIAQAYKDLGNRPWSNGSNDEWENVIAWGIHKTLTNPFNAIINGVFWTNYTPKNSDNYGGLWESYYGNDEVTRIELIGLQGTAHDRDGNPKESFDWATSIRMHYFKPDGPVGQPRRNFRSSGSHNGKPIDHYRFTPPVPPPTMSTSPSHLNTVTLPVLQMTPFTVDGVIHNNQPFPWENLSLSWQVSGDRETFFSYNPNLPTHTTTLMSIYPGDYTLTASAKINSFVGLEFPFSEHPSATWHIHTPVPPSHTTSAPSTHTIIWESSVPNCPQYTARIQPKLSDDFPTLRYKRSNPLSVESYMTLPQWLFPNSLTPEPLPLSMFGGGTWASSDNSVVAVTQDGVLTAHKVGQATISFATTGPITDYPYPIAPFTLTQQVTVPPAVASSLKLAWKSGTVQAQSGDTATLHALYYDNQIFPTTLQALFPIDVVPESKEQVSPDDYSVALTWTSTNPDVATVSPSGWVTALKPGITTIKVSAQVTPSELCEPQSAYFVVRVPELPALNWEIGSSEEVLTVHLGKRMPQPLLKAPTTIAYNGNDYWLVGTRWSTSDERVVRIQWAVDNRHEVHLEAVGEGEATITFQADGLPYSGYSENQEFTLTQRVRVPKPPQLAVASTLTNVSKTTVEYLPLGSSLTFPYTVSYTYEGEAYPLVNEGWTTSNAAVADVMKTESGWWLFAQTEGEAVLTFHAEGGAYGFESFEWERRVNVVSILPPAPPEEETPPTPPIEEEPPVVPPTPPEEETPTPPTPPTPPEEETPPTPPVPPVEEEPPVLPPAPSGVITIHWTDGDADKVLKVGEQFRLRLLLTMDGETYTFPNGGAEWLSSNEGVVAVNWGELQALKPGFATIYAHVAIGERAAVVSRYITVPKDGDLYGRAGVEEVVSGGGEATYYSLRGQYIGKTLPAEAGVYVRREGGKTEKVLVRRRR